MAWREFDTCHDRHVLRESGIVSDIRYIWSYTLEVAPRTGYRRFVSFER